MFWQTEERLKTEKKLGAFSLPDPKRDYPVNYVLDGQQRLTSLFSTFQTELEPSDKSWTDIYFDMEAVNNPQDTSFFALADAEVNAARHFPVKAFFDTVAYRHATKALSDEIAKIVDSVQERFKEYRIQNQTFETSDRNTVAIVFERINRAGTELNLFELLAAWSWSDDFDLIEKFRQLQEKIEEHGYVELVDDRNLQLRICAAVITGETSPSKILDLQGDDIRNQFGKIEAGILGAIDFLKRELGVAHYNMLPFPGILVPLSVFFATDKPDGVSYTDAQRRKLKTWFWRSVLTRRFSSDVTERQSNDIIEMRALLRDERHSFKFPNYELKVDFDKSRFAAGTSSSKTLVLMLSNLSPHSFLSGGSVDVQKVLKKGSRHEFHHIFPKAYLDANGVAGQDANVLANICFLLRSDNNSIRDKPPSQYFDQMSQSSRDQYLREALCEYDDRKLGYEDFVQARTSRLVELADSLADTGGG